MSHEQDEPVETITAAKITLQSDEAEPTSVTGEVIKRNEGDVIIKFPAAEFENNPELFKLLSQGKSLVTVWAQLVDSATGQLVRKGQTLSAWVRVKRSDGTFETKTTTLIGIGVVTAIIITSRATRHYKSR